MLFLSYAQEDKETAGQVARWLEGNGFEVFRWEDPRRRGREFIRQIEEAIQQSEAFLVLLSPSFLASDWCRRERDFAMRREQYLQRSDPHRRFIHVLHIVPTSDADAGFLGNYDMLDLTSAKNTEESLGELASRLQLARQPAISASRYEVSSEMTTKRRAGRNQPADSFRSVHQPETSPSRDEATSETTTYAANRKAVMVIYGHDTQANTALFDWLRAVGLRPQEWDQLIHASRSASPYIGQVLDQALRHVQAVIAFFTPDERVTAAATPLGSQGTWWLQARPNVLIEAGMALITHPTRTILVVLGTQELPSDLAGRHYIRLNHTDTPPLHKLATRLRDAGCDTDTTGTDWLNPARFPNRD